MAANQIQLKLSVRWPTLFAVLTLVGLGRLGARLCVRVDRVD